MRGLQAPAVAGAGVEGWLPSRHRPHGASGCWGSPSPGPSPCNQVRRVDRYAAFPVYSFHATSSPAMQFGIIPKFCDAAEDGTISPKAISSAITPRTKAIVVTHMWGVPCDMRAICEILERHPHILLFEDCSHAHGAKVDGKLVGTFGDAAAWSLQGQKIISGGEGGITLTKHAGLYHRQLLWGHYNKRCRAEIPEDHPLSSFSLTGAGAKNRAHPLAVAVALTQLRRLDTILRFKRLHFDVVVELFVRELHARGLGEVDIPKSTGLLHREPLYTSPQKMFPHLYTRWVARRLGTARQFPVAQAFYDEAIKIPVWASREDQETVDHYVNVICDVARELGSQTADTQSKT
ncbi:hypothetical protein MAPG_10711 [Magnaporthiopsis poae ATCC 64411]|uniref:Uncharacterized protein n=1 Tax=Magnaporthiopsis poae (strain ATCC 64411 / 73-15) TaxID=644358 RepID=A0A0C4EDB6_MAGP6|nr:hypothetical protein MAPG_10711 [Magnaporthiopsis poae ATCC 64411]